MIETLKTFGDYGVPLVSLVILGFVVKKLYYDSEKKEDRYQKKIEEMSEKYALAMMRSVETVDIYKSHNEELEKKVQRVFDMWIKCQQCKTDSVSEMMKQTNCFVKKIDGFYSIMRSDNEKLWAENRDLDFQVQGAISEAAKAIETLATNNEIISERFVELADAVKSLRARFDVMQGRQT